MHNYDTIQVSVIIPVHNEEKYIKRCIRSVHKAIDYCGGTVEIIVVCNRCTDNTADIALRNGARVIVNEDREIYWRWRTDSV